MFLPPPPPPKIPQENDSSPACDRALANTVIDALKQFRDLINEGNNGTITVVTSIVAAMRNTLGTEGTTDVSKLASAPKTLLENGKYYGRYPTMLLY
jgi:hypothetical protein